MFALADRINVGDLQRQAFAQTQSHAVEREEKHSATQHPSGGKLRLRLFHGDDVKQMLNLGGFDEVRAAPAFAQQVQVKELEAVKIEFDGARGMGGHQVAEKVGQSCCGKPAPRSGFVQRRCSSE